MVETPKQEIKLFYCYAREDKHLRDELEKHLSWLKRRYQLANWHDREILPGEEWEQVIDMHLNSAHLILLLISPDFMASDYCFGKEMQRALERHKAGTCRVVPILLRPTYWEDAPFSSLQLLPTDAIAITRWPDRDEAFEDVVTEISRTIKDLLISLKPKGVLPGGPQRVPASLGLRYYMLPREGDNLERSADKLAFNESNSRYAIADGVETSFLPGKWAEIVTVNYVLLHDNFAEAKDIVRWLQRCSREWYEWVVKDWVPRAVQASGQKEWDREIELGAATTFVGCSFSRDELAKKGSTIVQVDAVGDAEFFLATPPKTSRGRWECKYYYRLHLEDFGQQAKTLATPEQRVLRDYKWIYREAFSAERDDCIVLATDALAQWILRQIGAQKDPWGDLLSVSNEDEFKRFVIACRLNGEMEVDDTTVMIIPLTS